MCYRRSDGWQLPSGSPPPVDARAPPPPERDAPPPPPEGRLSSPRADESAQLSQRMGTKQQTAAVLKEVCFMVEFSRVVANGSTRLRVKPPLPTQGIA